MSNSIYAACSLYDTTKLFLFVVGLVVGIIIDRVLMYIAQREAKE